MVKFGICSFYYKSVWFWCVVDGKFWIIFDFSCIDLVEGFFFRFFWWVGIFCCFLVLFCIEFVMLLCKFWLVDCVVWSCKFGCFWFGLVFRFFWIFLGFVNWRFEWSCWSFFFERVFLYGLLSIWEKKRNFSCIIIFIIFIGNWKYICDVVILCFGDLKLFIIVFVDMLIVSYL